MLLLLLLLLFFLQNKDKSFLLKTILNQSFQINNFSTLLLFIHNNRRKIMFIIENFSPFYCYKQIVYTFFNTVFGFIWNFSLIR